MQGVGAALKEVSFEASVAVAVVMTPRIISKAAFHLGVLHVASDEPTRHEQ